MYTCITMILVLSIVLVSSTLNNEIGFVDQNGLFVLYKVIDLFRHDPPRSNALMPIRQIKHTKKLLKIIPSSILTHWMTTRQNMENDC